MTRYAPATADKTARTDVRPGYFPAFSVGGKQEDQYKDKGQMNSPLLVGNQRTKAPGVNMEEGETDGDHEGDMARQAQQSLLTGSARPALFRVLIHHSPTNPLRRSFRRIVLSPPAGVRPKR